MIYSVRHATQVEYASPVAQAVFNLRLIPWRWIGHKFSNIRLSISPLPAEREDRDGPYCINTTRISFAQSLGRFDVLSEFQVQIDGQPDPGQGPWLTTLRDEALAVHDISILSPAPYLFTSRIAHDNDEIRRWAAPFLQAEMCIVNAACALIGAIHAQFTYRPGVTDSATPPAEAFHSREGVCQDFAHVMIIALRSHGIPAAYASGYLRTSPPAGQARMVGADAMHAWVNVWCGNALGWVGFDPTNNCIVNFGHIQIGMGRDYADVSPIDGRFVGSAPQKMRTAVDVIELA